MTREGTSSILGQGSVEEGEVMRGMKTRRADTRRRGMLERKKLFSHQKHKRKDSLKGESGESQA
jgi:hypothetical protein